MVIRKKKKRNIILKLIVIIILGIICSFILINYFSKNISPFFLTYAEDEVTRFVTLVVNESINDEIINEMDDKNLFEIVRNNDGEIQLVSYNTMNVNILLNNMALIIQENLKLYEVGNINESKLLNGEYNKDLLKQGIVCEIPFGMFLNSSLISNIGPKIPVKFNLLGDVVTNIVTDIKEYGINNALLEVSIEIVVNIRVTLPFISNKITVTSSMPISMKVIQGSIPEFYSGGFQSSFGIINRYKDI